MEWSKDKVSANDPPTKLDIFRIIESLESNPELQIDSEMRLPRHLIANLLNEHEATLFQNIPVYAATAVPPQVNPPRSTGLPTSSPYVGPKNQPNNGPNNPGYKPKDHRNASYSRSGSRNNSKSPDRGRQPSKRLIEVDSLRGKLSALPDMPLITLHSAVLIPWL